MAKRQVPLRFEEDEFDAIKAYAEAHCGGNFSLAVRELCAAALAPAEAQTAIERRVEQMLEEGIERMAKVASKGTKASLAALAVTSTYMPAIGDGLRVVGDILVEDKRGAQREDAQEKLDTALYPISSKQNISQNGLFSWSWTVGGKLQAQPGTPSLLDATRKE